MNSEVVKEINKLQVQKAELKVNLYNVKNDAEADKEEVEEINKQIAGIEKSIAQLVHQLKEN